MAKRLCRICNTPLSRYNKKDICFCHQSELPKISHIPPIGAGHATSAVEHTRIQEYGLDCGQWSSGGG